MRLVIYTNSISPHQLPLARKLVAALGEGNVLYAYGSAESKGRRSLGWNQEPEPWCRQACVCNSILETCDTILVGGLRPIELMEKRAKVGLQTLYMSERWFKPPIGMLRLLHPKYFRMALRIVRLIKNVHSFTYLPIGIHAARDMARLCGLFAGDLRCLFRAPELAFEKRPGGRIFSRVERVDRAEKKYGLHKMRMWGYFVESSKFKVKSEELKDELRVLWVGRLLKVKRVDAIIRAIGELSTRRKVALSIYGTGPEEMRLKKMAAKYGDVIRFHLPVPIDDVRKVMHDHDVYVLASNAYEGWGAVVSEALEEGMRVMGTYEAGSSATVLPNERLFHAGDWRTLTMLLEKECEYQLSTCSIGDWTADKAGQYIASIIS